MKRDNSLLRVEFNNTKPIELTDLTSSFSALAESFKDYAHQRTGDPQPDNLRLYVKEIKSGSVIADLVAMADQAQFIVEHVEVFAGFVANANELVNFFMGRSSSHGVKPTQRQARQIAQIVEPVAKDFGSQFNMNVSDGATVNVYQSFNIGGMEAAAVQNEITRYLGPQLPASRILEDQLMVLEQVKNDAAAKSGDRGIIEAISTKPVKLQFASETAKRTVLNLQENPLQCVFQVTVEVRSTGGRPVLYRIIEVADIIFPEMP